MTLQTNYTSYDTPRFRKLSDDQTERLHHASLEVLDRTGVVLYEPEAVALLQRKGLHYDEVDAGRGARVRIPPGLVEWALGVAPKRAVLCDRNGRRVMPLERNNVFFGPGSDCPNVIDVRTGERRVGTLRDVEEASLICDALPNIDFLMSFCIASDVDQLVYDRHQMRAMLTNSVKPILTVTMEFSGAQDAVLMAEAVVGGAEALRRNPITALYINVTHPLRHNTEALQKLLFMAEKGLPTTYAPVVLRGMSGPVTAAGAIALSNAGELAGLVISQLKREGAPVILTGGVNDMLDMRTMVDSYTDPQNRVMLVELAHRYGLPIFGLAGCSDSKIPDEQAAAEAAFSIMLETLAGAQMAHDVGYLDGGLTNSIEQIVMCDEMIGYAKQFMKGLVIDEETLALDLIDEIGPFGDWMGADHTRRHYKEDWYPKLFERRAYEDWSRAGGKTLRQRAQDKALKILATHKPEPLPTDVAARLDEIVAGARP